MSSELMSLSVCKQTSIDMVVHRHKPNCCAKFWMLFLGSLSQCRLNSLYLSIPYLLNHLFQLPNLVCWCSTWNVWVAVFKVDFTAFEFSKVTVPFFLNCWTSSHQIWYVSTSAYVLLPHRLTCEASDLLSTRSRSQGSNPRRTLIQPVCPELLNLLLPSLVYCDVINA